MRLVFFSCVGRKKRGFAFLKAVCFELKLLHFFQSVWHLLKLYLAYFA